MTSETIKIIGEQIDVRELHMAHFKLFADEANNTVYLGKGSKAMKIHYDKGKDTYEVETMRNGITTGKHSDVYWEDLQPLISKTFKFEYVMRGLLKPRESFSNGGLVRKTGFAKVHKGELVIPASTVKRIKRTSPHYAPLRTNRGQGGYFRHRAEHSINARKSRRRR